LSKVELKEKMFTLFKASVVNAPISGKGPANEPFRHEWRLPNIGNVQCRKCWGYYNMDFLLFSWMNAQAF